MKLYTKSKGLVLEGDVTLIDILLDDYYKGTQDYEEELLREEEYKVFLQSKIEKLKIPYSKIKQIIIDVQWQPRYNGTYVIIKATNKKGKEIFEEDLCHSGDNDFHELISESYGEYAPEFKDIIPYLDMEVIKKYGITIHDENYESDTAITEEDYTFSVYEGSDS